MYDCQILQDSISDQGHRLTTFQVVFPRFLLAEMNTHRMFSRNSASSRAVPTEKVIAAIREDPFVPIFNKRVRGMGVGEPLSTDEQHLATDIWLDGMEDAISCVDELGDIDKSRANRLLEPFKWHTAIISATDWHNFFALRDHKSAQPEFQTIAAMMHDMYLASNPVELGPGEWHTPGVSKGEIDTEARTWPEPFVDWDMWMKVSVGRVAGVSYERTEKRERQLDIDLHDKLVTSVPPHLSPTEHVARPFVKDEWEMVDTMRNALRLIYEQSAYGKEHPEFVDRLCRNAEYCGNFHGWYQYRATIPNEHDASLVQ